MMRENQEMVSLEARRFEAHGLEAQKVEEHQTCRIVDLKTWKIGDPESQKPGDLHSRKPKTRDSENR